jgi:group II intron reverse transcriptase/maturase
MILGAIYEEDFYEYSYGFRPGRSPHHALRELRQQCEKMQIGWIVDCDISGFFDSIDRRLLQETIKKRVNDGSLLRLIGKWLRAGVVEQGIWSQPETGTPQGGVISPILANIFLHTVLDEWFTQMVQPRMKGKCFLVRFADDFIIGCELEFDARRIMEVLPKRFARFKLKIHPTKSKMISFGRPTRKEVRGRGGCGTFDFLGFTLYWAKSRKGHWVIKLKTARKRLRRAQKAAWQWCRHHRHWPLVWQQQQLRLKLLGHYQYYGVRGNYRELEKLKRFVERAWRFWLSRRTRKGAIPWDKFARLHAIFILPKPRVSHCFFAPAG